MKNNQVSSRVRVLRITSEATVALENSFWISCLGRTSLTTQQHFPLVLPAEKYIDILKRAADRPTPHKYVTVVLNKLKQTTWETSRTLTERLLFFRAWTFTRLYCFVKILSDCTVYFDSWKYFISADSRPISRDILKKMRTKSYPFPTARKRYKCMK